MCEKSNVKKFVEYIAVASEHQHTDECLKYAAQTGKPFCIAQCADSRRKLQEHCQALMRMLLAEE